jgi:D-beta-D-heptose 7-phosphate kinase/D-beta-D-heptose 1-phosphate adenosyltransferase
VDWEHTHSLSRELNAKIIDFIRKNIDGFDAVIIEDYGKGVINMHLLEELISLSRLHKKIITVDPKEEHFQYYRGVTSITPNRRELENAIRNLKIKDTTNRFKINNDRLFTDKDIDLAARQILEYLELESILVTLGEHGMQLFEKSGRLTHIPTVAQEVFDVSGAGDTVISTFTLALCCGATKLEAAHLANYAAGIVVGKVGTAVTTRKELLERLS